DQTVKRRTNSVSTITYESFVLSNISSHNIIFINSTSVLIHTLEAKIQENKVGSYTFLAADSSCSRALTRLIAAFSISSFSSGMATGFMLRTLTFSSSSAMRFIMVMYSALEMGAGAGNWWFLIMVISL
ncbi:hypothetical protein PanWU01x14_118450, partial [Parasponia andersonii]